MSAIEIEKKIRAAEKAKRCLEDLKSLGVFQKVEEYLNSRTLECDPDNKEMAQRLVISRQLLASFEREIVKVVKDGEYAKIRLKEIEATRSPVKRVFSRGY